MNVILNWMISASFLEFGICPRYLLHSASMCLTISGIVGRFFLSDLNHIWL